MIAVFLVGLVVGFGSGFVYCVGGIIGGIDVIVCIFEKYFGISMGCLLLFFDVVVLFFLLIYIDVKWMMYILIVFFVFSCVVDFVFDGVYAVKGILIVFNYFEEIG